MDDGELVRTTQVPTLEDLPLSVRGDAWVRALEHERIPFVGYPAKWTFSMLREPPWSPWTCCCAPSTPTWP